MSDVQDHQEARDEFDERQEEVRQELIEIDNEMHAETGDDSPVDVGEAGHVDDEPTKKGKSKK